MRSVATAVDLVQADGMEMYSTPRRNRHQQRASKGAQMALSYDARAWRRAITPSWCMMLV
nr:hypothetical protein [Oxalobacteraceae bacterium]